MIGSLIFFLHRATIAQYRAQLKRALRETLPDYQENLDLLLRLDF